MPYARTLASPVVCDFIIKRLLLYKFRGCVAKKNENICALVKNLGGVLGN
jgi:hypothetical protein